MEVREVQAGDLDAIQQLLQQLGETAAAHHLPDSNTVSSLFREMARFPEIYRNYVAVEDGQVLGFLSLVLYKTLFHRGGTALVNELIVSRRRRRQGIGIRLIEAAIAAAVEQGMDEIEVSTELTNDPAYDFYRKAGFDREYRLLGREF